MDKNTYYVGTDGCCIRKNWFGKRCRDAWGEYTYKLYCFRGKKNAALCAKTVKVSDNCKVKLKKDGTAKLDDDAFRMIRRMIRRGKVSDKIKAHFGKRKGKKYYKNADGSYQHDAKKIGKKYYAFSGKNPAKPGYLYTGKDGRVKKIGSGYYCLAKDGSCRRVGWYIQKYKDGDGFSSMKLFYFKGKKNASVAGKKVRDATTDGVTMDKYGVAKMDLYGRIKLLAMETMNRIVAGKTMSMSQKLRAAFSYMTNRSNFRYADYTPDLSKKNWEMDTAEKMLTTHHGSCSSFACAFAALAREIGYSPYVIATRVHGSRDHAADGFTKHKLVEINGRYYDPEGIFARWLRGTGYGLSRYPVATKTWVRVRF